jgi:predicted O-linked N-acetylglucosamine transferase (SPINDLY family)
MGAPYYDYILTDGIVAPFEQQQFYSEKLVHLPHCYLPIDSARSLSQNPSSRKGAGLPDGAFVFCAINATHKLTPKIFDIWMRLLSGVESSVLWLSQATPHVMDNLKREAAARGIPSDRLVFAPFTSSNEDHLARLSLADLFLDTQPYNAHASACDAIWAGVPMVTALGKVFAGRVGASILTAAGLPELIASSLSDYETLAFRLARDPAALNTIRAKLAANRASAPLFDTARFTRNLEAAYNTMWEGYCRGQSPTSFKVSDAALSS